MGNEHARTPYFCVTTIRLYCEQTVLRSTTGLVKYNSAVHVSCARACAHDIHKPLHRWYSTALQSCLLLPTVIYYIQTIYRLLILLHVIIFIYSKLSAFALSM